MQTKELKIKNNLFTRHWFNLCLIMFVSIIVMLPMLTSNHLFGHDSKYHFEIIRSLNLAFKDGHFFNQIIDLVCQDYGYGTGLFYSLIPHGIAVIIMNIFNCSDVTAVALEMILLFTASGIIFYFFTKAIFKNNITAVIGAVLYLTTPYILNDVFIRFAFSEAFFTLTIPMITWGLYELINNKNVKKFFPLFTIGYSLAFLTHFTLSLFFTLFAAVYICFYFKKFFKEKLYIPFIISVSLVLIITTSFYIPMLINYPNVQVGAMNYGSNFLSFNGLWSYFYYWLIFSTAINIVTLVIFTKKIRRHKGENSKNSIILYTLLWISFALSTSLFPYFLLPDFVGILQYAWRFYMVNATILTLSIVYLLKYSDVKVHKIVLLVFTVLVSVGAMASNCKNYYSSSIHKNKISCDAYFSTITGKSENLALGASKKGDYYPTGATKDYIFYRANDIMVLDTESDISELANYQSINQLSFILKRDKNPYVVLNIPYSVCDDIEVYQITDNTENKKLEIVKTYETIDGTDYLRLDMSKADSDSKITISYQDNSKFDEYLKNNPFEFIVKSGDANFTNFNKQYFNKYSVDITANTATTIELPTLYYKGYSLKYVTENSTQEIVGKMGENGFLEIDVSESGTLYVEFEGRYITLSNYVSLAGAILFVGFEAFLLLYKRKKPDTNQPEDTKDNV